MFCEQLPLVGMLYEEPHHLTELGGGRLRAALNNVDREHRAFFATQLRCVFTGLGQGGE